MDEENSQLRQTINMLNRDLEISQKNSLRYSDQVVKLQNALGLKGEEQADAGPVVFVDVEIQTDQFHIDNEVSVKLKGLNDKERKELLQKAMKTNPLFISNVYRPIKVMIKRVLSDKSDAVTRTPKTVLALIAEVLQQRVDLLDDTNSSHNKSNLD